MRRKRSCKKCFDRKQDKNTKPITTKKPDTKGLSTLLSYYLPSTRQCAYFLVNLFIIILQIPKNNDLMTN